MPVFLNRELEIVDIKSIAYAKVLRDFKMLADTEFTQKLLMRVDCIGIYLPGLINNGLFIYEYKELTYDFHPIINPLSELGHKIEFVDDEWLATLIESVAEIFNDTVDTNQSARRIKKDYEKIVNDGVFDELLADYRLERNNLCYHRDSKAKESYPIIQPVKTNITNEFFFAPADLFKTWGQNHQSLILNSDLQQYRSLRVGKPISQYLLVDGKLNQFDMIIRDSMYRFPPRNKSLAGQSKTFALEKSKIDIKTKDIAIQMGLKNESEIMENMTLFRQHFRDLFLKYNAQDIFTSHELSETQQKFYDIILESFNIESIPVADTTGSNVAKFIKAAIFQHFDILEEDKESKKILQSCFSLTRIQNLQETPLNDFGIQPFMTVGGLLFTRMVRTPFIQGWLGDADLQSCYATAMSNMNIYLGQPMVLTFKHKKYKPTLREAIECVRLHNAPNDAWFVRVTGELKEAINTLIPSDLRFKPQSQKIPTLKDLSDTRQSIEKFNAYKTNKPQATSTILTKEIKFGLINNDLLECLKLLPESWYKEFENLLCDAIVYIPGDLIADDIEEYLDIVANLPDEEKVERFNVKEGTKGADGQRYKNNAVLRFPVCEYWQQLKTKRGEFKKAKNPVQEVYKLFQNSGYGVMACLHLATNNLIASNMITAYARANAWLMTNFLNGFAPITDGTSYSWEHIAIGYKFRQILANNPEYLIHFDNNIKSGLTHDCFNQKWIDAEFKTEMAKFYDLDPNHYLIQRFSYELKTEKFKTKNGEEIETSLFTRYHNTNAGNYVKGIEGASILIDDTEYDFERQEEYVKARSFQGDNPELLNWYLQSLYKYEQPFIYSENKVIKFGDGNALAIKFLKEGIDKIAHPMGFSTTGYKMMKLVSRSQFLFQTEKQLRNFETNEIKLSELSKEPVLGIKSKDFWEKLDSKELEPYGVEKRQDTDYYEFAKTHPVGVGFELLALSKKAKGSIQYVRQIIDDAIKKGCINFNAELNLGYHFKSGESFKYLLATVIVLKKNAEDDLRECLINSADEPTIFVVRPENIKRLEELQEQSDTDE